MPFLRFFLLSVLLCGSLQLLPFSILAAEEKSEPAKEEKPSLIDVYSLASIIPKELLDLQDTIATYEEAPVLSEQLPPLATDIKKLLWEVSLLKNADRMRQTQTSAYDQKAQKISYRLKKISDPINRAIGELSTHHVKWLERQKNLSNFSQQGNQALAMVQEEKKDLAKDIAAALRIIEQQLAPYLDLGKKVSDLQVQLYAVQSDLRAIDAEIRKGNIQQSAPSMFSADFYRRYDLDLLRESGRSMSSFFLSQLNTSKEQASRLFFFVLALVLLGLLIHWSRRLTAATSGWQPFASLPVATTFFLASTNSALLGMLPLDLELPREWEVLLHIVNILAVVQLLGGLQLTTIRRRILSRLAYFLAFTLLLVMLNLPKALIFLYVFSVAAVALVFYAHQLRHRQASGQPLIDLLHKVWGVVPLLILLTGLAGYQYFAIFFFSAVLSTVVSFLMIWMLFRLNTGLLELLLSLPPLTLIRDHQQIIRAKLRPILIWLHVLLLLAVLAVIWTIYPTVDAALSGINSVGFTIGGVHISPGFVLAVVLVFYLGLMASKTSQFLLLREVLPRYTNEKGVQMSISRLAHYAILLITFLVMLRVVGFELAQLALLGGALGVGIGFGLQAIVNNFACGLILLFERPVKVGDTIQLGNDIGEVKEIGLRATIIQTYDNAEIVVPNSTLITGQVTNWTLANRKVRLKIPVGVAYGTDVAKVQEILLNCAANNPMVLSTPKPVAFFLAFGASSMDFELRVWLPEFLSSTQVLSDLNQDIEAEFSLHGIEIPFPQNEVRLRTVSPEAASQLHGQPLADLASTMPTAPVGAPSP